MEYHGINCNKKIRNYSVFELFARKVFFSLRLASTAKLIRFSLDLFVDSAKAPGQLFFSFAYYFNHLFFVSKQFEFEFFNLTLLEIKRRKKGIKKLP